MVETTIRKSSLVSGSVCTTNQDTDCETYPPSDSDDIIICEKSKEEEVVLLLKMEELNKLNEADLKSVASRKSLSSLSTSRSEICNNNSAETNTTISSSSARSIKSISESIRSAVGVNPKNFNSTQLVQSIKFNNNADEDEENIDLWTVWGNLIKSWEVEMKRRPNCVKELVRRGVPQHFRAIAWQLLSNTNVRQIHEQYTEYLRQNSPYEKVILRDIPRTYPEKEFFRNGGSGQQSLFNVIKSYSIHDREVGYCQGSAFIVGQLLLQMPEEEAFAVFVQLMEKYRLRELYKPMMTELGLCMFQLEFIVQEQMPDLYMHFNNTGFDTSMYASSWFLTLFTTTLPLDLANRIMDLFLVDGIDSIFRVSIAILQQARIDLLKLDMEGILKYFQREIRERYENDYDLLFTVASRVILNAKRMKKLEKEYMTKRSKEQEEAIELRRLRTENRLLRQRIDYLEHESSALADRLIRGQVDLAQQADNCLNISHELNILRDVNSDAHRRLEDAYDTIRELSCAEEASKYIIKKSTFDAGIQVDDTSMIEHIHSLQQELIETHYRKSELENSVREFKLRIHELESTNYRLKEASPDNEIATIQEELIRVKMREAESSLSLKEMRQRLAEIEQHWTKYIQSRNLILQTHTLENIQSAATNSLQSLNSVELSNVTEDRSNFEESEAVSFYVNGEPGPSSPQHSPPISQSISIILPSTSSTTSSTTTISAPQRARGRIAKFTATLIGAAGNIGTYGSSANDEITCDGLTLRELEDQFIGLKIHEADTLAELKEMRQRVMELETQNHVCTNQLKRQDDELKRIKEEKETIKEAEREVSNLLKDEQRKFIESQSEMKEQNVMQRLQYTEAIQIIADLKQFIAQLESKNAEKIAHAQLRGSSICDMDDDSLASGRSTGSVGGDSLASEEMSAFLADVTTKSFNNEDLDYKDDILNIINKESELKKTRLELKSSKTEKTKSITILNETSDSGLNLSD